jgi:cobyrinic acid a,c-diamide synthase
MQTMPRLVISATRGGLGKTTLSIGIIAAWRKKGRQIAVFKKGPDFIDAGWLGIASGRPCYNRDLFMMEHERIVRSFQEHTTGTDGAVIEGNRGLYDGMDESGSFSTARLARLLKAPVVLIVDCTKATSTVAALVLGCQQYDPSIDLAGVILNNVSSGRHEGVIRRAIAQSSRLPVLGAVPRMRGGEFPERHMGLTPFHEHPEVAQSLEAAALIAEQHLDLEVLWKAACAAPEIHEKMAASSDDLIPASGERVVVGVIRDRAFQFYYPDNLEALERNGASLREINALHDKALPGDLDALYIGGGFPETQAAELAANTSFCASLKNAAEEGLPIYAECGGLIYLGRSLSVGGKQYPMTDVLPVDFVLEKRPQAHGYTVLTAGTGSTFLDKGVIIKGHEFHYSRAVSTNGLPPLAYEVNRGGGIDGKGDGLVYRNVVAAYTHIHALGTPEWAGSIVRKAHEYRKNRNTSGKRVSM